MLDTLRSASEQIMSRYERYVVTRSAVTSLGVSTTVAGVHLPPPHSAMHVSLLVAPLVRFCRSSSTAASSDVALQTKNTCWTRGRGVKTRECNHPDNVRDVAQRG